MRNDEYWNLFWLSGLPEAWMMSRPGRGDFNTADMTAKAAPHVRTHFPDEVQQLYRKKAEQGEVKLPDPTLQGE